MNAKKATFTQDGVKDYESRRYRSWDQRIVHSLENRILNRIFDQIGETSGFALDLPCGYGRFTRLLLERGLDPISTDYAFEMVKRSYEKTPSHLRAAGINADAKRSLPFQNDSFSLLLSMRFFHHVFDTDELQNIMEEFARVSNKWVIASYYQSNPLHRLQRWFRGNLKKTQTRINTRSRSEVESLSRTAGLKIMKIFPLIRGIHSQHIGGKGR